MGAIFTLAALRVLYGLDQEDLARKAGVSQQYISLLERHQSRPSSEVAERIAKALGTDVGTLWPELSQEIREKAR